jgi:hypothetical protein
LELFREGNVLPKISEFSGMKIYLYYDDHEPPHFHVRGQWKTRIEIHSGQYMKGDAPLPKGQEKDVLAWLEKYRDDMMKGWNDCRAGTEPTNIPPLQ